MYFLDKLYTILNPLDLTDDEKSLFIQVSNDIVLNKRISFKAFSAEQKRKMFGELKLKSMYIPYKKLLEESIGRTLQEPYEGIEEAIVF